MAAHVLVAPSLGLGVFASAAAAHPRRPFRNALGAPTADANRSWAWGTHRGHEVMLGFSRERPSAQVNQWDVAAMQLFRHIETAGLARLLCWIRMPSLLLGLEIEAPPEHPSNAQLTGNPTVDSKFSVRALAPPAVPALFARDPRAQGAGEAIDMMLGAIGGGAAIRIEDTFITLAMMRPQDDAEWFKWAVDLGVNLAERLAHARAAMPPPPWEPATAAALEALARARGFQFDRAHLAVKGASGDLGVEIGLSTAPPPYGNLPDRLAYAIDIIVRYRPLGAGLRVFPEHSVTTLTKVFIKDAKVGDEAFDKAFIVHADAPNALSRLLTPEVRGRLVTMAARSPFVSADDSQISMQLGTQAADATSLGYALDDVLGAAHALVAAASGARV
jgi:hypothetical protein